ncbi:MAG: DUF4167 domain-containing protein [Pseudomonadota bacterium]
MKHNNSNRRSRGRGSNRRGGNNRAQVFDSNGPDVRIRGTAHQICEKYEALAKDARSSGDHVLAESYLQHAEHYQRIIMSWNAQQEQRQENRQEQKQSGQAPAEDLSLPQSILGDEVKSQEEAGSSKEKKLEDA